MYVYTTTNPCLCNPLTSTPPCPDDCNCLRLCNITVNANDDIAVGPCAASGTLDVTDEAYEHDLCACGEDTIYWSVAGYDNEIFNTVSIDKNTGVLTWITQGPEALVKQYGVITLKVCCGSLSAYMCVIIGVKDLCNCPGCDPCNDCDPCTGDCLDVEIHVEVNPITTSANTEVDVSNN